MIRLFRLSNLLAPSIRYVRSRSVRPYLRDLYFRRLAQGPELYRPRSSWLSWHRETELNAFFKRIGEDIPPNISNRIFTDISYKNYILSKANVEDQSLVDSDNSEYARLGYTFSKQYILTVLRATYRNFPEEWVVSIADYLLSSSELAFIASHLGVKDLIMYVDQPLNSSAKLISAPPSLDVLSNVFMAIVGVISENEIERAKRFLEDFILTRLTQLDLMELLTIPNPFELLTGILLSQGRGFPEARLQCQSSMNTILACYQVGIYSDRELISEAPGETLMVAQNEAACEAVRALFGLTDYRPPLRLDSKPDGKDANVSMNHYLELAAKRKSR